MKTTKFSDADLEAHFRDLDPNKSTHRDRSAVAAIEAAVLDRREADVRIRSAVDRAREHGVTWVEIGAALGTSHQAAMQRYKH